MTRPRRSSPVWVAFLAGLWIASSVCSAAAQMPATNVPVPLRNSVRDTVRFEERTDAFRRILYELKFTPIKDAKEFHHSEPRETLVIVLGRTTHLSWWIKPEQMLSFANQGGAVLIATDNVPSPSARECLASLAGVRVTGERFVSLNPQPGDCYHDTEFCPFLVATPDSWDLARTGPKPLGMATLLLTGDHPALFRNLRDPSGPPLRVATNAPSRLRHVGWLPRLGLSDLAYLPANCINENLVRGNQRLRDLFRTLHMDVPANLPQADEGPKQGSLFAVGGYVGKGRALVVADHSIFINAMILPPDNGNMDFASNCLHWLRGGPTTPLELMREMTNQPGQRQTSGPRNKVLFWDDGRIWDDFKVPLKEVPNGIPPISEPAVVAAVNQTLANLEDRDAFNERLLRELDLPNETNRFLRLGLYAVTLALIAYSVYHVTQGRHRLDPSVPLLSRLVSRNVPGAPVLEQRRKARFQAGNVWETAHQLARECFASAGVAVNGGSASPPPVIVRGGWWQRRRLRKQVQRLWRLAHDPRPEPIAPTALERLGREMEELKTALANGSIRLYQ
jgi:hypothetical protein